MLSAKPLKGIFTNYLWFLHPVIQPIAVKVIFAIPFLQGGHLPAF